MQKTCLQLDSLSVSIEQMPLLHELSLTVSVGSVHAIMGPNGSGKSSLAHTIMGHPSYTVTGGHIVFKNSFIEEESPDARARKGIFLAFQYPFEIEGITVRDFLRTAYNAWYAGTEKQIGVKAFHRLLQEKAALLKLDEAYLDRSLNVGFSGGEKKQIEMLQMAVLQPKLVILDEIDSGLDVDALRRVCECLQAVKKDNPSMAVVLITHYNRILKYIHPDYVHIMTQGRFVRTGDALLADEIEVQGYQ